MPVLLLGWQSLRRHCPAGYYLGSTAPPVMRCLLHCSCYSDKGRRNRRPELSRVRQGRSRLTPNLGANRGRLTPHGRQSEANIIGPPCPHSELLGDTYSPWTPP